MGYSKYPALRLKQSKVKKTGIQLYLLLTFQQGLSCCICIPIYFNQKLHTGFSYSNQQVQGIPLLSVASYVQHFIAKCYSGILSYHPNQRTSYSENTYVI